jgi:hypothetical protein
MKGYIATLVFVLVFSGSSLATGSNNTDKSLAQKVRRTTADYVWVDRSHEYSEALGNCSADADDGASTLLLAQRVCCKICRKGKACGNSCISREYKCHKPPGCACDG